MCFSATASFIAGAVLIPTGLYSVNKAFQNKSYLALAAFPLFFGIQQLFEGGVWLALGGQSTISLDIMSKGFLFFAYFFWPFIVPLSALLIEPNPVRRKLFLTFSIVGFLFGAMLYVPLLIYPDWMSVSLVKYSVLYEPTLILPRSVIRIFYAIIVAVPLLFSSIKVVRIFGIMIFLSVLGTTVFFAYAFVSIWCFFAAILSAYIVYAVRHELDNHRVSLA